MAIRSTASHSTAQLRRLVGQLQAEVDSLDHLAIFDAETQTALGQARDRLTQGIEAIEDAIQSLRALQQVRPSAMRPRKTTPRAA